MTKFLSLLVSLLLILSCLHCSNSEVVDNEFKVNYLNCLQIIQLRQMKCHIDFKEVYSAYLCLEAITGIESKAVKYGDSPFVYIDTTYNLLFEDIENWNIWYRKNEKSFRMDDVKSIFSQHYSLNNERISWPGSITNINCLE